MPVESGDEGGALGEAERLGPWFCGPEPDRGAYVVDDLQGVEGGEGLVVRAERRTFEGDWVGYSGPVSLKLLTNTSPERVAALQRRWQRLAEIEHPHLARPLEAFAGPGLSRDPEWSAPADESHDVCYVATAWVDGEGLRELVPLEPAATFDLVRDLAAGLAALHGRDLMHRDLHPGNVVVDESGQAVLIDFGSTRPADGLLTATVSGVVGFIAPECLHGQESRATDRWGLGMLTIFMLLGHPKGQVREDQLRAELDSAMRDVGQPRRAVDLICQMVDADPDARADDVTEWARELTASLAPVSRRRRRRHAATAAAAAIVLLSAGFAARSCQDDPRSPGAAAPTDVTPAEPPTCERAATGRTPLDEAVGRLAPDACLSGEPARLGEATFQPLSTASGDAAGVVLLPAEGEAVHLTQTMWTSFRAISDRSIDQDTVRFGGHPVGVRHVDDPAAVIIQLSNRGILIGPRDDTQMFWVPGQVLSLWLEHGGVEGDLGFPTSNPYIDAEGVHLDFERGVMHAYGDAAAVAAIAAGGPVSPVVEHPASQIGDSDAPDLANHMIRQLNGTIWWVDDDQVRHWIPDDATRECLGGDEELALDDLHGWDVAALPLGPMATCD